MFEDEYLASLGVSADILDRMSSTDPDEVYWLTEDNKRALGIEPLHGGLPEVSPQ